MKTRVLISTFILACALPALAATTSADKTDHMKKHQAEQGQMHSKKGKSESMHHKTMDHKKMHEHGKAEGKNEHHMNKHKMSKHHMDHHKMDKKHEKAKPASTSTKGHHKKR